VYRRDPAAASLLNGLQGSWTGEGKFASGKRIASDVTFSIGQDSCWLKQDHRDRPPNKYLATSLWGIDKSTNNLLVYVFDSFQGHREFICSDWNQKVITLTCPQNISDNKSTWERFIYNLLDKDHFRMTYEKSTDGHIWKMIDELTFTRN
jgi:hypothetical protein